jgi:hypothetical protein
MISVMPTKARGGKPTAVYLEVGKSRVFACAVDWPGWCRSGKTEELALEALAQYAERYRVVPRRARIAFPRGIADSFEVVERIPGSATTDFGAPGGVAKGDAAKTSGPAAKRTAALLRAAWAQFDDVAEETPKQLRMGPRGGGRDRDKMVEHVISTEAAYARKLGIKHDPPKLGDDAAVHALREAIVDVLGAPSAGTTPGPKGWPPRYVARRIAWHLLDHAWEMQDRAT